VRFALGLKNGGLEKKDDRERKRDRARKDERVKIASEGETHLKGPASPCEPNGVVEGRLKVQTKRTRGKADTFPGAKCPVWGD